LAILVMNGAFSRRVVDQPGGLTFAAAAAGPLSSERCSPLYW
jgi:hypothetical protein